MEAHMRLNAKTITKAAIIAAIYVLLTYAFQGISFTKIQFRLSEALTVLPMFLPAAIPGLFIGCLIANFLGGGVLIDVALGSLATLAAACLTRRLRKHPLVAMSMPVLFNGVIVGPMVYFVYEMGAGTFSFPALLLTCLFVALGEAAVIYTLGLALGETIKRTGLIRRD
jgi:uncharacterized membrane protein